MSPTNQERRKKIKESLTLHLDEVIAAIESRISQRKQVFDYENEKDTRKLDELALQREGIMSLK